MYDVNYFIRKFEAIPEELWLIREFRSGNKGCVNGHCSMYGVTSEFDELTKLFNSNCDLFHDEMGCNSWHQQCVNNGDDPNYQQSTPKQRILAALYDIRDKELSEANINAAKEIVNKELVL